VMSRVRLRLGRRSRFVASACGLVVVITAGWLVAVALAAPKPPAPTITSSPANPTTSSSASFTYSDAQAGVTFKCARDGATFAACPSSGISYSGLPQGNHTFQVVAVSGSQTSNATSFAWAIVPPAPAITGHPANPTNQTSASFTFTDSQAGVHFQCSRDGASFGSCSSPKTYSGLAAGSHTFRVEAFVGSNPPSVPASFAWLIDRAAPTISVSFPANNGLYNSAGWSGGCASPGICGTVNDPAGVQSVGLALRQQSTNKYWNGNAFTSTAIVFNAATLGTPNATSTSWRYAKTLPPDGKYTVSLRATDAFANTTASNSYTTTTFTIDTVAPAAPTFIQAPSRPSNDKSPEFEFIAPTTPLTFTCWLDGGAHVNCSGDTDNDHDSQGEHGAHPGSSFGEWQFVNLAPGPHCFNVNGTDPAGNVGPTNQFCWTISGAVAATTIAATAGTPQFTNVNTTYPAQLQATVTGSGNTPVSGASVTFTAPSSGASGAFGSPCSGTSCTVTTNASGIATAPAFTANGTPGGYVVTATTPGVSSAANFSLINSASFTIADPAGGVSPSLVPGLNVPLNLRITNPNPTSITIPTGAGGIHVAIHSLKAGCVDSNFTAFANAVALTIPPGTWSLSSITGSANWPALQMLETHTNQDICKNASLTLTYSGSATG